MSDALTKFLDDNTTSVDHSQFLSDEIKKLDEVKPPSSLFKYFPTGRSAFFRNPILRFTQRIGLNDPFELMKRWSEFGSKSFKKTVLEQTTTAVTSLLNNKSTLLEILKQEFAKQGVFLGPEQMAEAAFRLLGPSGDTLLKGMGENAIRGLATNLDHAFSTLSVASEFKFNEMTEKWGILSLTDTAKSRAMWSLYASAGQGFVVEFDTSQPFFCVANGRHSVWPVTYRDEPNESFIENPMALFLTKHTDYFFEHEWRMLKPLDQCDETITHDGKEMHMSRVVPGMIKSIIFGYNYDQKALAEDGAQITTFFDAGIKIRAAFVNRSLGQFDFQDLN